MSNEEIVLTADVARTRMEKLLAPCFASPPTAGVVMVVVSAKGTEFFSMNMDTLEVTQVLQCASDYMSASLAPHPTPEKVQ